MKKKEIIMKDVIINTLLFIAILLLLSGCSKPEQKGEFVISNIEVNAILTEYQKQCDNLGEQIINECMQVNPRCFELKQQWDAKECQSA